ncbi:MAG TPA: 2-keto-4-pentenoate hydratase [Stellaceae bacterium]|nr:2-keto-4-pentenoate hydratase [Stellaceae bacterium]
MNQERLAALLIQARISGQRIGDLPAELAPPDEAAAYALQDLVVDKLRVRVAAWKVGAASPTSRPTCAPIFAGHVVKSPAQLLALRDGVNGVEAELAFRVGRDLPARATSYREDEVWQALDSLHVAIEYLDSRFRDRLAAPEFAVLTDNISNGGFCWGEAVANWREANLAKPEAQLVIDGMVAAKAVGGNTAGHPKRLVAWLANHLMQRGRPLTAGTFITTGSHTGLCIAPLRAPVIARFTGLGEAQLTLVGA